MIEALELLLDPLRSEPVRRALAEVAMLGAICGPLAFWVVSERLSYATESLAHGMLPGLVLAALVGAPLLAGAGAGVLAAAGLIALAGRDQRIGPEAATAIVVSGTLGLGALLALAQDEPQRLEELLFGDPLAAGPGDLAAAGALVVLGGTALAALHRPLAALALDRAAASALGLRPERLRLALLLLVALAVAVAVQGLGNLLVLALLVAPAVAAGRYAQAPGRAMVAGALLAVAAGVVGIYASFHLGSAAGASVALALTGLALAAGYGPSPGRRRRPRSSPRSRAARA